MSRLTCQLPFESQGYECRPGHTLRWLCGISQEPNGQPCTDTETSRTPCTSLPDSYAAKNRKDTENEST